jgi:hypothetical protein
MYGLKIVCQFWWHTHYKVLYISSSFSISLPLSISHSFSLLLPFFPFIGPIVAAAAGYLSFDSFDITKVLTSGTPLLASGGQVLFSFTSKFWGGSVEEEKSREKDRKER